MDTKRFEMASSVRETIPAEVHGPRWTPGLWEHRAASRLDPTKI